MYCGEEVTYSTKLFRVSDIKMYEINNAMVKILEYENRSEVDEVDRSDVYQLICQDCGKKYIGQMGYHSKSDIMNIFSLSNIKIQTRPSTLIGLHVKYRGYSKFCQKKEIFMISLKKFYIYSETKRTNKINEETATGSNTICDVIQYENDRCQL
jgi:hypothetical protein